MKPLPLDKFTIGEDGVLTPLVGDPRAQGKRPGRGRVVISKADFDALYIEANLERSAMAALGVGSKIFQNSYHRHYPDPAVRAEIRAAKLRRHQRGNTRGTTDTGLRHLIERKALEAALEAGTPIARLCLDFGISEPTLHKNLRHHGLERFIDRNIRGTTHLALRDVERLTGIDLVSRFETSAPIDLDQLRRDVHAGERALQRCKESLARIRYRMKLGASGAPTSRYERAVIEWLVDHGIDYVPQFRLESFAYDLYLPATNTLVEIDGGGHDPNTDAPKNAVAAAHGYPLLRLDFRACRTKKRVTETVRSALSAQLHDAWGP